MVQAMDTAEDQWQRHVFLGAALLREAVQASASPKQVGAVAAAVMRSIDQLAQEPEATTQEVDQRLAMARPALQQLTALQRVSGDARALRNVAMHHAFGCGADRLPTSAAEAKRTQRGGKQALREKEAAPSSDRMQDEKLKEAEATIEGLKNKTSELEAKLVEQAKDVATHVAELGEAKENFLQSQAEIGQFQQLAKALINELMGLGAFFTADRVPMNSLAATSKAEWEAFCKRAGVPADDHACELARRGLRR